MPVANANTQTSERDDYCILVMGEQVGNDIDLTNPSTEVVFTAQSNQEKGDKPRPMTTVGRAQDSLPPLVRKGTMSEHRASMHGSF